MIGKASAVALILTGQTVLADCADDKVTISGDWGQARFTVELADDPSEHARGLMFVEQMPTLSGMLFVYDEPRSVAFWMKNTLIPLDMLFVSAAGEVMLVHENAIPHDETPIPGGNNIGAVLEINGGMADRLGIKAGDVLQHPSFGSEAIAPCDKKVQG